MKTIGSLIRKICRGAPDLDLSSGNCGTFAFGVASLSKAKNLEIGFLTNEDAPVDLNMLAGSDDKIYHVVIIHNNRIYDERGRISRETLREFAKNWYNDSTPVLIREIFTRKTKKLILRVIENQTDWTYSPAFFINLLKRDATV